MVDDTDGLSLPVGVTEQRALKQLARIEARAIRVQRKAEQGFVRANRTAARSFQGMSNSARGNLQNVSFQLQDIFVQISSGQGVTRALSQQLPQLLGGFGALGAVFGVAVAAGLPLGSMLLGIGEEADGAEESIKALTDAVKELEQAQNLAGQSPGDLLSQYGGLADEARQLFEINRQIASIRAQGALDTAARGIAGELGVAGVFGFGPNEVRNLEETITSLRQELDALNSTPAASLSDEELAEANREIERLEDNLSDLKRVSRNVDDLADTLGISEDAAREVVAQFALIGQAKGPDEQAQAMIDLADFINGVSNNLADAEEEGKALYDQLLEAAIQALELSKVDIASSVGAGADEAARLVENLERAAALGFGGQGVSGPDAAIAGLRDQGRLGGGVTGVVSRTTFNEPKKTGGRRSGGARIPEGQREAERLFDSTRTKAEKYASEVERINELHRLFPEIVTTQVRDRALGALEEGITGLGRSIETMNNAFANTFTDIITGAESASEALSGLLSQFASVLAQSAFSSLGSSLAGSLGLPGFAGGTNYAPGGLAIVGENGPELVNLPRGSQVHTAHQTRDMMGSSSGVFISIDARGAQVGAAEQIESKVRQMLPEITRASVAATGQARMRGAAV